MKKEKGLIIAVMVLFLVSGVAACIFRQYRDGQESGPAPVYVNQDRESQPQTTEKPEDMQEQKSEETQDQKSEGTPGQKPEETTETEPVQETGTEQSGADQSETDQSETEQPVSVYYAFTVRGDISSLNLRSVPDMDGKILGRLMPKQTGYVLEYGEEWSLVTTGKKSGYVNNRYIELEEIPEEDFPAEYRE